MLIVDGLEKRYGDVVALDGVSFEVGPGEIVGFLGPNGAGKTTTMRAIMGLRRARRWHSHLERPRSGSRPAAAIRLHAGRARHVPADEGPRSSRLLRDACAACATAAAAAVDKWLERLGLTDRAGDTVQSLSSGNQQRVQLALALINEPELLVLDEPFSGLDPIAVDTLSDVLREQVARGVALLLSSHQLDLVADVCSSVVIVDRGAVVMRGDVAEMRAASPIRYVDIEFAGPTKFDAGRVRGVRCGRRSSPLPDRRARGCRPERADRRCARQRSRVGLLVRAARPVRGVPGGRRTHQPATHTVTDGMAGGGDV